MAACDAKHSLRTRLLAARRAIAVDVRQRGSAGVVSRVLELPAFQVARHVVGFVAAPTEPDPRSALAAARARGACVYLPRMAGDSLRFVAVDADSRYAPGPHGIPEPDGSSVLTDDGDGAVILVPGVGFDPAGTRLGRGGGWYDRALAAHPRAVRVGLAWDVAIVPALPREPWDVSMHFIITESRVLGPGVPVPSARRESPA